MTKKKDTVGKTYTDRWCTPIKVHCYLADNGGHIYMVNSHYQAVPQDEDAPAISLDDLDTTKVRVLKPEEVLSVQARTGKHEEKPDVALVKSEKEEEVRAAANMFVVLQGIPDKMLADELRRRGYFVTAVKPALIEI